MLFLADRNVLIDQTMANDFRPFAAATARLFMAADCSSDFIRPPFHLLFHTGMRLGKALALEWVDIDFDNQKIAVRQSKYGEGRKVPLRAALANELIVWKPKSQESRWCFRLDNLEDNWSQNSCDVASLRAR